MVIVRGWTSSEAPMAARQLLAITPPRRAARRKLVEDICGGDPTARKRATDVARLASAKEPGLLSDYADVLLDVLLELRGAVVAEDPAAEWQSFGYLALTAAHNVTTRAQRVRLVELIRPMIEEGRAALQATAIEVFARVAAVEPELRDEALAMLGEIRFHGTPATSARARAMLALLLPGTVYNWRADWETRRKGSRLADPESAPTRTYPPAASVLSLK